MLDFPNSPTLNQVFTSGSLSWTWDGTKWVLSPGGGASITIGDTPPSSPAVGSLWWDSVGGQLYVWYQDPNTSQWVPTTNAASLLPPASTTTLGGVKVDGTSIKAAADGTISTVLVPMGDNRIINGDMRIDQRNNGAVTTPASTTYVIDRWRFNATQAAKFTTQRAAGLAGLLAQGFGYYLSAAVAAAYTPLATDYFQIVQPIEADMTGDLAWGTGNAQPVTLSFLAFSTLTGTFSGTIGNDNGTRSYPFTYSIPVASTWTKVVVTIPGDTAGTWVLQGNATGLSVHFDLGSGANFRGPAGAWAGANYVGATGAVNVVATAGAGLNVTGIKLEVGSVATPYNRQSPAKSLADCQRYYYDPANGAAGTQWAWGGYQPSGAMGGVEFLFPVTMRASPTVTIRNQSYAGVTTAATASSTFTNGFFITLTGSALGTGQVNFNISASAEL